MSDFWQHLLVAVAVIVLTAVLAKIIDRRIGRHYLSRPRP